jgi:hypothetical protein
MTNAPTPCTACKAVAEAAQLPDSAQKLQSSYISLAALLVPAVGMALLLWFAPKVGRFSCFANWHTWPVEFWILLLSGSIATVGGLLDWGFHRWVARCRISKKERKCELIALACGGVPLFTLMAFASASAHPGVYVVPVICIALFTTVLICYDEFIFHAKRCKALESAYHRMLVFGNGIAFLAWAHWCFSASRA